MFLCVCSRVYVCICGNYSHLFRILSAICNVNSARRTWMHWNKCRMADILVADRGTFFQWSRSNSKNENEWISSVQPLSYTFDINCCCCCGVPRPFIVSYILHLYLYSYQGMPYRPVVRWQHLWHIQSPQIPRCSVNASDWVRYCDTYEWPPPPSQPQQQQQPKWHKKYKYIEQRVDSLNSIARVH